MCPWLFYTAFSSIDLIAAQTPRDDIITPLDGNCKGFLDLEFTWAITEARQDN